MLNIRVNLNIEHMYIIYVIYILLRGLQHLNENFVRILYEISILCYLDKVTYENAVAAYSSSIAAYEPAVAAFNGIANYEHISAVI